MANLKAVILDYYETIARISHDVREQAFDALARELGLDFPPGEAYLHWRELTASDRAVRFPGLDRPPLDGEAPPFITFRDVWLRRFAELFERWQVDVPPARGADAYRDAHIAALVYPEVRDVIDALRGRYRVAVLSDADDDFLLPNIERHGLAFDEVVTSEEVGAYKPHVSIFREACARLGVPPGEAVYVGDSPWADIEGARHADLRAVWIDRWGIDWPQDVAAPETRITQLSELPEVLAD